jgi:tight adherence protein B
MLIVPLVFLLVLGIVLGAYWMLDLRPESHQDQALRDRLKPRRTRAVGHTVVKAPDALSGVGVLDRVLSRWEDAVTPIRVLIDRAGVRVTVGAVLLGSVSVAVVMMVIGAALTGSSVWGAIAACLAGLAPTAYLRYAARKRLDAFEEQFPEAVDMMARALRAGHALTTALQMVGDEVPDPVGREFKLLFEQQNFGMSLPDALKAFAVRMPILDARFFVTALLTQREMGGNLSEVLDNLASVIRERFKVKRQVRVVSAHGRITGVVLGALPLAVAGVLFVVAPTHIMLLFQDPLGIVMVSTAVALQCIGLVVIHRIVNVEY